MASVMNSRVTTMSSKPWRSRSRTMCSMHGTLTMGIMGFGWLLVSGLSLVPFPPAIITAFIRKPPSVNPWPPSVPLPIRVSFVGTLSRLSRRDTGDAANLTRVVIAVLCPCFATSLYPEERHSKKQRSCRKQPGESVAAVVDDEVLLEAVLAIHPGALVHVGLGYVGAASTCDALLDALADEAAHEEGAALYTPVGLGVPGDLVRLRQNAPL